VITEVALFRSVNARLDSTSSLFVPKAIKPFFKNFSRVDRLRVQMYQMGYITVN
jgi:hypothetical protein